MRSDSIGKFGRCLLYPYSEDFINLSILKEQSFGHGLFLLDILVLL